MDDLVTTISNGSMKAAIKIARVRNIGDDILLSEAFINALRAEIKAGFKDAVAEANEAAQVLNEEWARQSLNASCVLFAVRAFGAIQTGGLDR
jgi:hypothetical protein